MDSKKFTGSMWAQACDALDRAERLHRQFFSFDRVGRTPAWQPPVDLFESDRGLLIRAVIPDARSSDFEVRMDNTCLRLSGQRAFPAAAGRFVIHRLEIPYGRIERVISLPPGHFELEGFDYKTGCLEIRLRRTGAPT